MSIKLRSIFILSTFLLLLFVFTIIAIVFFTSFYNPSPTQNIPTETYRYQEINPFKRTSRHALVDLDLTLSKNEFLSFPSPQNKGSQIIISKLGSGQFKCTGTCVCSSERRISSSVLTRPLLLLISAVSAGLAYQIAEKSFHDQCLQFSDTCEGTVTSNVESCSEEKEVFDDFESDEKIRFFCQGHCIDPDIPDLMDNYAKEEMESCIDFDREAIVDLRGMKRSVERYHKNGKMYVREMMEYPTTHEELLYEAKSKFAMENLAEHCELMNHAKRVAFGWNCIPFPDGWIQRRQTSEAKLELGHVDCSLQFDFRMNQKTYDPDSLGESIENWGLGHPWEEEEKLDDLGDLDKINFDEVEDIVNSITGEDKE